MATLTQLRNGIKAALGTIDGLSAYAIEPASPKYPAAWIFPQRANYHADYDGSMTWTLAVSVAVAATEIGHAQSNLDPYLAPSGAKSVVAALEADPSLGGAADSLRVVALTGYGARDLGGSTAIIATFEVEVFA